MGCLKLHIEPLPNLRVIHRKKTEKPLKKMGCYYPFGLLHKGYNNVVSSNGNALGQKDKTFQGQKIDDELGLNWHAFKWRNYDASIGRFFNLDPLAEKFFYNSPYAFSENKVISHFELEGLEAVLAITSGKHHITGKNLSARGQYIKEARGGDAITKHFNSGGIDNLVSAFKDATASDPKGIGFVAIWGHGVPGRIWGENSGFSVNTSDLSQLNNAIKNGDIKFADQAVIFIGNCNSATCGTGDVRSFAAELSKITGASVIGGNAQVGMGQKPVENSTSMIFWMYNQRTDDFIQFKNGLEVDNLGGKLDVISIMNRVMNPLSPASTLTPAGIAPLNVQSPTPTLRANANPIGWGYSGDKPKPIYNTTPNDGRFY